MIFLQALIQTKEDDECHTEIIPYSELTYDHISEFVDDVAPLGLSPAYWKESATIAALAIVSLEKAVVVVFPQPSRRAPADAIPAIDTESAGYQALMLLLTRVAGEFYAFDLAPLAMGLYLDQGLRLQNAIDIQSAFPEEDRYSIVNVLKAALGEDTKMYEKRLADAFNDMTYSDERTASLHPVARGWLAHHLASVDDAVMTYSKVKRIDTFGMNDGVSH
jgi:regulator of nonsense transcripts 1